MGERVQRQETDQEITGREIDIGLSDSDKNSSVSNNSSPRVNKVK